MRKSYLDQLYQKRREKLYSVDESSGLSTDWRLFNDEIGLPIHPYTELPAPLTPYQLEMGYYRGMLTVTNKANKVGVTDLYLRLNLLRATVGDCAGYQILFGSSKLGMASENIHRTAEIIDRSDILRPLLDEEPTANEIHLKNGTEFFALPRKVSSLRSWPRVKSIFLDEAAHYELLEDEDFFSAALGRLVNTAGHLDIVSTPHGQRGYFYRVYTEAVAGRNGFKPWFVDDQKGVAAGLLRPEMLEEMKRSMSKEMYAQEMQGAFIVGANSAIEPEIVEKQTRDYASE